MFKTFAEKVTKQFDKIAKSNELYIVDAGDLYQTYLAAFPEGTNPIFRERTEHDCQYCKNFINNVGSVVAIANGSMQTVWDVDGVAHPYDKVAEAMAKAVRNGAVKSVFRTVESVFGRLPNVDAKNIDITWHHLYCKVPRKYITSSPGSAIGSSVSKHQVLNRGLNELVPEHFDTVLDLIESNSIYRGEEFKNAVKDFQVLQRNYLAKKASDANEAGLFVWENCEHWNAGFRNTVIGTLLVDLSNGDSLEEAVRKFEQKTAPTNYKRPTAIISKRMIEDAVKTLKELDMEDSLARRFARISDISVNDVLYVNNAISGAMKDGITSLLMEAAVSKPRKASNPTPVSIDEFMSMSHKDIEIILSHEHEPNFVTVTAPVHDDVNQLFKWGNNFAWSYDGNVTDSIKQRVRKAGGNVTNAKLRCSLAWFNLDDLDIHCRDPLGRQIYYGNKQGVLDVDMNVGSPVRNAVENLSWREGSLADGVYTITVNNFNQRETNDPGCILEVEHDGKIQQFRYDQRLGKNIPMLELHVQGKALTKVVPLAKGLVSGASGEKWGVSIGNPVKVNTIMLSPNHWENSGNTGNKHWFLILEGCKNPEPTRGIYNEFLSGKLEKHRKVFEILGDKTKCVPVEEQLSGVGFSSTRKDKVSVIADGRPYVISF
jgi:hypothetical protein